MEFVKVTGLVLKSIPYKEKDKLITLFTLERGKITVKARGVMSIKSKLAPTCCIHNVGYYELDEKGGFYTLIGCETIDTFFDLSQNLEKFYVAEIFAETADRHLNECQVSESFFLRLLNFYKILVYENISPKLLLLKFLTEIIAENGVELDYSPICARCGKSITKHRFSYAIYGFVCENCISTMEKTVLISEENANMMRLIIGANFDNIREIAMCESDFKEIMRSLYVILHNILNFPCNSLVEFMKII